MNWLENERVLEYTKGNSYSHKELDQENRNWFNGLLQIAADESIKEIRQKIKELHGLYKEDDSVQTGAVRRDIEDIFPGMVL